MTGPEFGGQIGCSSHRIRTQGDDDHLVVGEASLQKVTPSGLRRADHPVGPTGVRQPGLEHAVAAEGGDLRVVAPGQVVDGGHQGQVGGRDRSPGCVHEVRIAGQAIHHRSVQPVPQLVENRPGQAG